MRSIRLAFRVLFKTPFVTTVAILSLALGIGANSAIFSLFDQILLTPLPVASPTELVNLSAPGPKPGSTSCGDAGGCETVFSYPMFRDLERQQTSFTGIAAHRNFNASFAVRNDPLTGDGLMVSGAYFSTLGVQPALGRLLTPSDDAAIGAHFVTVLGHSFWATRFGGDSSVLGQTMLVNGQAMTIVGVAPERFRGTSFGSVPLVYVPISMRAQLERSFNGFENRSNYWIYVFARLKPGVSIEQAHATINGVYQPIITGIEAPLQRGMSEQTLVQFRAKEIGLEAGWRGQSTAYREAKGPLWMLFGVTGIVLLIACANIANLLLARGAGRSMEMGVRLSLGATRKQLLVQLLTESVLLALLGGIASLFVAQGTLAFIGSQLPPDAPSSLRLSIDPSVAVFAALMAVATGVVFGMFPALHSTRSDLVGVIRSNAGQIAGGRTAARFRSSLVTFQIALSMALLASAGLFLKSLANVARVDLGVNVDQVVAFRVAPMRAGYDSARAHVLFERTERELAGIPGVNGVTSSMVPLLAGSSWATDVIVQGFQSGPDVDDNANFSLVGPGYFSTLGMTMLTGREFTTADAAGTARVAVVNETFVRKFNLGTDAVGKFMSANDSLDTQIIGVVRNAGYSDVKDSVPAVFYLPWRQGGSVSSLTFYVRSSGDPTPLLRAAPALMKSIDSSLPLEDLKTMPQQIRENTFLDRMISTMTAAFAILATLLAGVGLYGVLAYTVAQRTREIGVRMALGADARRVRGLVMRQVAWMVSIGGIAGIAGALGLGTAARSMLFGLEPHDPVVFVTSVVALLLVAVAAGFIPAQRAARVSPMNALRYE